MRPRAGRHRRLLRALRVALEQAANTILVASKKVDPPRYAVCVVLGTTRLDVNRKVSDLLGVKRLSFADADTLGAHRHDDRRRHRIRHPRTADLRRQRRLGAEVVMGGGNRSSKLLLDPRELAKLPETRVVVDLAQPIGDQPGIGSVDRSLSMTARSPSSRSMAAP